MSEEREDIPDRLSRLEGSEGRTADYLAQITALVMKIDRERIEQRERDARERAAALDRDVQERAAAREREERARQERLDRDEKARAERLEIERLARDEQRRRDEHFAAERRRQSWQQTAVIASSISVAILLGMLAIASGIVLD